jgi:hypothetical protein
MNFAACSSPSDLHGMRTGGPEAGIEAVATVWDAMYAAEPTARQRELWPKVSRMRWPTKRARRIACCIGRRGWKTSKVMAWSLLFEALCVDHSAHASPGSRIFFVVVCPVLPQAREAVRAIRSALDELAGVGVRYEVRDLAGNAEITITAPAAGCERVIAVMPADSISVRGRAIAFAAFDEASFLSSDDWLADVDRDLVTAIGAGMVQFPEAVQLFVSSPGAPQGVFYSLVEKPGKDVLVVRAPSWVMNPNVTQADCWRTADNDPAVFAQEFEASRFGYHNSTFISASDLRACIDPKRAGLGPRTGSFAVGLDIGQRQDASAIVVCSAFVIPTREGEASLRGVAVDYTQTIEPDKKAPPSIEEIVGRALTVAKAYGNAPIVADSFNGVSLEQELVDAGWKRVEAIEKLKQRRFFIAGMSPANQGPRWSDVRRHVLSKRVAFHPTHERLLRELAQLKATQLGSGGMRVEGKRDDVADAFCLALSVATLLPVTGEGAWQFECDGRVNNDQGFAIPINPRWFREIPGMDGNPKKEVSRVPPETDERAFAAYAARMVADGFSTDAIERWKAKAADEMRSAPDAWPPSYREYVQKPPASMFGEVEIDSIAADDVRRTARRE